MRTAGSVGMPACSMKTSWVAAVPPCIPSTTTTSAPAATASFTSWSTRVAPTFTYIGIDHSVASRSSSILIRRSSGPTQSGWRLAERWSMPGGSVRMAATRALTFCPSSIPPPPGLAPWPTTISTASAWRRSAGSNP